MSELSRRTFLRLTSAAAAGVIASELSIPVGIRLNNAVEDTTGRPTGNAGLKEFIEKRCENEPMKAACAQDYIGSPEFSFLTTVQAPIIEEIKYRVAPSLALNLVDDNTRTPFKDLVNGTDSLALSRREAIVGALTSLWFGLSHNHTQRGFDVKTIPASHVLSGGIYWYLQRKFGFVSNTIGHSWYNYRVTRRAR